MSEFRERENFCLRTFEMNGPYWHLFTSGKETPQIFKKEEDFGFAMNVIAQTALKYNEIKILTFELMGNHLHILVEGPKEQVLASFSFIRKRLGRGLKDSFPDSLPTGFAPSLKEVTSLEAMRNTIVYINRNGFVADANHTPYSYPWGAGSYFFGLLHSHDTTFQDTTTKQRFNMFHGRIPDIPDDWPMASEGYLIPTGYCAIQFAKSMFRNAHHYFSMLCKNVEGYSGVASEIDDEEYLTDSELFSQLSTILRERYQSASLRELSKAQRLDLTRTLHYELRSSNSQIRRVLGLTLYEVDSLFPMSAKK